VIPPTLSEAIIQFWQNLSGVADALRHIHSLEYQRGESTEKYHGYAYMVQIIAFSVY
jgi:hypothetical protein